MKKLLFILMVVILGGCNKKIVPQTERKRQNQSEEVTQGQVGFMKNCNRCHPSGMAGLGPAIVNKPLPGFMIKLQVRNGFGAMPSFDKKHLSKKELDHIVAYIKKM